MAVSPGSQSQGTGLGWFTSWYLFPYTVEKASNELRLQPLNPAHHWSGWRTWRHQIPVWRSQEVDLPRDLALRSLSCLNLVRDPPVQESQEVDMS